jgi:clan AA aspartic protease (TIGR02281 family)
MAGVVCRAHPENVAVGTCHGCLAPVCEVCRVLEGMRSYCASCLRRERRAPRVRQALFAIFGIAACGGLYWIYRAYERPYDYGKRASDVDSLEADLAKEPCDRPKVLSLLERMVTAGNNRGAIDRAAAFFTKCGDEPKLRDWTHLAHKRLGELDKAAGDLTKLIEHSPTHAYYRAWRAAIYEEQGNLAGAAEDLEKALSLYPAATDIPLNLATIYEKQGRFCDATVPLEGVVFRYSDKPFVANVRARLAALDRKGACTPAGGGRVTIRALDGGMFATKVRLGEKEIAVFVVDTGASYVTLTRRLADRLKLDVSASPKKELQTVNGKADGLFVIIPSISIGELSTERVPAVVVGDLGRGVDGLLGQTFLSRFEMKQGAGMLELRARAAVE